MKEFFTEMISNVYTHRRSSTRVALLLAMVLAVIIILCCCYVLLFKDVSDYGGLSQIIYGAAGLILIAGTTKVFSDKYQGEAFAETKTE